MSAEGSPGRLKQRAESFFTDLQGRICREVQRLDGEARFEQDRWSHDSGQGGGATRVLQDGRVFEKAGVNFSAVSGHLSPRLAERLGVEPRGFSATGLSLILHPRSPMVPTTHLNVRYIELDSTAGNGPEQAWFGGGADLTPYYLYREDAEHFHGCFRRACDRHDPEYYPRFKKWCDEYFHLPHRGEARGVGGIFFDYLRDDLSGRFAFVRDVGQAFLEAYPPIVERRCDEPYGERERQWQLARRGRYVEFNLIHDRGTRFGLETNGRMESILMSLPPMVSWPYDHRPEPGSQEEELIAVLHNPVDWLKEG